MNGVPVPAPPGEADFWTQFYTHPATVPPLEPYDYDLETDVLVKACRSFCDSESPLAAIKELQTISDPLGFESPLTPPEPVGPEGLSIGETFVGAAVFKCSCGGRCPRSDSDDFYTGQCGLRSVGQPPFSYVHVNLSRKLDSAEKLKLLLRPLFKAEKVKLRMVGGDSGSSAVFLASDRHEERRIRRLLRTPGVRLERGIRIFQVTQDSCGIFRSSK